MTSPSIGEARTKPVASPTEDWSEVEALLATPGKAPIAPASVQRRGPPRLALGLVTLAALGGGIAVLKAAIVPSCRGETCSTRLEAAAPSQPAIRDVTATPLRVAAAAEPLVALQPIQQGRSIAELPPTPHVRTHAPSHVAVPRARIVAAKPRAPRAVAAVSIPTPIRRPVASPGPRLASARPMPARRPMRAIAARPVRLQQVFLSPNRYILVERR